eukprot:Nk52_evm21s2612 gene=Nk52_evmTU21s2612
MTCSMFSVTVRTLHVPGAVAKDVPVEEGEDLPPKEKDLEAVNEDDNEEEAEEGEDLPDDSEEEAEPAKEKDLEAVPSDIDTNIPSDYEGSSGPIRRKRLSGKSTKKQIVFEEEETESRSRVRVPVKS